ncbi:MAG: glycosyltransferase [Thermogemmata sp.]
MAELEQWAELFDEVVIVAPRGEGAPRGDEAALKVGKARLAAIPQAGGRGWKKKLGLAAAVPRMALVMIGHMLHADVVHVRCPGNAGLVGAVVAPLAARRRIAKYAGQWSDYMGEPRTFRWQRRLLDSRWWGAPVLAYSGGEENGRVRPFFSAALTEAQMERARRAALRPRTGRPPRVLYVGRLTRAKGAGRLVDACSLLRRRGVEVICDIVGEGEARSEFEEAARRAGLEGRIVFHGGRDLEGVLGFYEEADALALPSRTEGWPKVLVEAMAFGVPCVATECGLNGWLLGEGRGFTVPFGDAGALAEALERLLLEDEGARARRREACARFGQQYTVERFREELRRLMEREWGVRLRRGVAVCE